MQLQLREFSNARPDLSVRVALNAENENLNVDFVVTGDLSKLVIPEQVQTPTFRLNLWQATCFELFLGREHSSLYSEWNLSPSGDWATFDFLDYRKISVQAKSAGGEEAQSQKYAPQILHRNVGPQAIRLTMSLRPENWRATVEAEVKDSLIHPACILMFEGESVAEKYLTYWAPAHGSKLDFHNRDFWTTFAWGELGSRDHSSLDS